jgi:two-component system chemotaxis response regulator CheY
MKIGASQTTPSPAHILLVDDNRLGLAARKSVLEELGYRITIAMEGQQALDLYMRGKYDLLITDYKMPKMDGLELIKRVRGLNETTPIILLSGYADALGMTEANTGANSVISKSANEVTHLVRAVNRLLRRPAPRKKPVVSHRAPVAKAKRQGAS